MPGPRRPAPGDVWRYPYLWARQAGDGETEGRKPRPCALILTLPTATGETEIILLAITTKAPRPEQAAIAVPPMERRRARLDADAPLWIMLDEYNSDILERSWYFDPDGRIGAFGETFLGQVKAALVTVLRAHRSKRIRRSD
jgi:hypothetical protein